MDTVNARPVILVIEDDDSSRLALLQILLPLEANIIEAASGEKAFELIDQKSVAAIILDAEMPGLDGYQLLNKLVVDDRSKNIPVILLTENLSDEKSKLHSNMLQGVSVVSKPLNQDKFVAEVNMLIEWHQRQLQLEECCGQGDLFSSSHEPILGVSKEGCIVFANCPAIKILGVSASNLSGIYLESILEGPNQHVLSDWDTHPIYTACKQDQILQIKDTKVWTFSGETLKVSAAAIPIRKHAEVDILFVFKEKAINVENEKQLASLSNIDFLTKLPSYQGFKDVISLSLMKAETGSYYFVILYLDIDHFNYVNESLGNDVGDELLKQVAARLEVEATDEMLVGRMDGDEFAFLVNSDADYSNVTATASRLCDLLRKEFLVNGHGLHISCSIGIATYPYCGNDEETLIRRAKSATDKVKARGGNDLQFYTAEMNKHHVLRLEWEQQVLSAFKSDAFSLQYQPIYKTNTDHLVGIESRIVWEHETKGLLDEEAFIPALETMGFLDAVVAWFLNIACDELHGLKLENTADDFPALHLHVIPEMIARSSFEEGLMNALDKYELDADLLVLDIKNTKNNCRLESCLDTLKSLKEKGLSIIVDSLGTGEEGFQWLQSVPVDGVRLPESLVADAGNSSREGNILSAMVQLADALSLDAIAPVQDKSQEEQLLNLGVKYVQHNHSIGLDEFDRSGPTL